MLTSGFGAREKDHKGIRTGVLEKSEVFCMWDLSIFFCEEGLLKLTKQF